MSPSAILLDGNVLIALADQAHVHHAVAVRWFATQSSPFATCPITQGTLLRLLLRHGAVASPAQAAQVLAGFVQHPRHRFWPDAIDYSAVSWQGLLGHRQVTDAYLAALARHQQGRLATLDRGLAALHGDVVEWLSG
jgi:toxin-antitoxin system PIN domain toxin